MKDKPITLREACGLAAEAQRETDNRLAAERRSETLDLAIDELARRVADAAVAVDVARAAVRHLSSLPESVVWGLKILWEAERQARLTLDSAVREYRDHLEAAAVMARSGVRRGLEKVGEME